MYSTAFSVPLSVPAPGVLGNDSDADGDALMALLVTGPTSGTLTLNPNGSFGYTLTPNFAGTDSFTYRAFDGAATSWVVTVSLSVSEPTTVQPPTGLIAHSVTGNTVTLRWTPPAVGPSVTGYMLEGGINPGEVLASIPTNTGTAPVFTLMAPTGSFYVRIHALAGAQRSAASNEIRIHVNVPVNPSAPTGLLGLVNGSTLNLAWRNTYQGGAPTSMLLDVTGSEITTVPLGFAEGFGFAGVPGGTYTLRLRAVNAGGPSAPSDPITLTFPSDCSGPPQAPTNVVAYRIGSLASVLWEPAASGPRTDRVQGESDRGVRRQLRHLGSNVERVGWTGHLQHHHRRFQPVRPERS